MMQTSRQTATPFTASQLFQKHQDRGNTTTEEKGKSTSRQSKVKSKLIKKSKSKATCFFKYSVINVECSFGDTCMIDLRNLLDFRKLAYISLSIPGAPQPQEHLLRFIHILSLLLPKNPHLILHVLLPINHHIVILSQNPKRRPRLALYSSSSLASLAPS